MDWWRIRIDPLPLPRRLIARADEQAGPGGPSLRLCLPLIPDGRISLPLFRAEPWRARFLFLDPERRKASGGGRIELRDHQWFCIRSSRGGAAVPDLRIIGARFAPGEVIGLRPVQGVIELYRVNERAPVPLPR